MSVISLQMEMSIEHMQKIFGAGDSYIKKIEHDLNVTIVDRNGKIVITGEEHNANKACRILSQLTEISRRGNEIEEQSVNYAITLGMENQEEVLTEIDSDIICHTVNGKPIISYTEEKVDNFKKPDPIEDTPSSEKLASAEELYLAGVHVAQYRDPAIYPDAPQPKP